MRFVFLILLNIFLVNLLNSQDYEYQKYWYYRKRLQEKFMVKGSSGNCELGKGGKSTIITNINIYSPFKVVIAEDKPPINLVSEPSMLEMALCAWVGI